MNETASPAVTPAEKVGVVLGKLHPITRLLILAALLHLVGDAFNGLRLVAILTAGGQPVLGAMSEIAHSVGYSLTFVGGAASFEYLILIWRELKLIRAVVDRAGPRP